MEYSMPNYYIVPTRVSKIPPLGVYPDIPAGIDFEARAYDINNSTCKIKILRNEAISGFTQITEEEYWSN
jgi:hypothetical protein